MRCVLACSYHTSCTNRVQTDGAVLPSCGAGMVTASRPRVGGARSHALCLIQATRAHPHCTQKHSGPHTPTCGGISSPTMHLIPQHKVHIISLRRPSVQPVPPFACGYAKVYLTQHVPCAAPCRPNTREGATHGADESWIMGSRRPANPAEAALIHDMVLWYSFS